MLPDSPFYEAYSSMDLTDYQYINWILPIDICADLMLGWLVCISVYYLFLAVQKIVMLVISGIAKGVSIVKFLI